MNINVNSGLINNNPNTPININVIPNSSSDVNIAATLLKNLNNGDVFSGEVTNVENGVVTITLDNGSSFNASLINNASYSIGDKATFVVEDNKNDSILLKALSMKESSFDVAILDKSLELAGLAKNDMNRDMVLSMMKNNLPINSNALNEMSKELFTNPGSSVQDLIVLHRMGIEVNGNTLKAYNDYKQYNGAILSDLPKLTDGISSYVKDIQSFAYVTDILTTNELADDSLHLSEKISKNDMVQVESGDGGIGTLANEENQINQIIKPNQTIKSFTDELKNVLAKTGEDIINEFENETAKSSNIATIKKLPDLFNKLIENGISAKHIEKVINSEKGRNLLSELARESFGLDIKKSFDNDAIKAKLAKNINKLEDLSNLAKQEGNTILSETTDNMKNNMDFLNNMNQFVATAQVSLKNIGDNGEGELYVYKRKRNSGQDDETLRAFLHLDMTNLGPMDVYVTLKKTNVTTDFVVEQDEILDFLEANMDLLTKAISNNGYSIKATVSNKDNKKGFDFVDEVIMPNLPVSDIKRFRFDVKA